MPKQKPNYQPISMIPTILRAVEEVLEASVTQLETLQQAKGSPYALDDLLVARIIKIHTKQKQTIKLYLKQCAKWKKKHLTEIQSTQVDAIENSTHPLSFINDEILSIAKEYKENTIDNILDKDDVELALEFLLSGKFKH